nr:MAG: hypothetical protein [Tombusviridae sp.]
MSSKNMSNPSISRVGAAVEEQLVKPHRGSTKRRPTRVSGGGQTHKPTERNTPELKGRNKPSGNARVRRSQQTPLHSKHRWSSQDLWRMTKDDASERILALQAKVEKLQRELNSVRKLSRISSTKSVDTIGTGIKEKTTMQNGQEQSTLAQASSQLSIKKSESNNSGMKEGNAQNAPALSVGEQKKPAHMNPAGKATREASIATDATPISVIGKAVASTNQAKSTTGDTSEAKARDLPPARGPSYATTVKAGPVKQSEKPILATIPEVIPVKQIVKHQEKRKLRLDPSVKVDPGLLAYLQDEFAFKPRTSELWECMHTKLSKHLNTYDLQQYSYEQLYEMKINITAAAMAIPPCEQRVRAQYKDKKTLTEMKKHEKCFGDGDFGRTGWLMKTCHRMTGRRK